MSPVLGPVSSGNESWDRVVYREKEGSPLGAENSVMKLNKKVVIEMLLFGTINACRKK